MSDGLSRDDLASEQQIDPAMDEMRRQLAQGVAAGESPDVMAQILRDGLAEARAAGDMSDQRATRMARIIDEFDRTMADGTDASSLIEMMTRIGVVNELGKDAADAAMDLTGNRAILAGTVAARLNAAYQVMARRLLDEQRPNLQSEEVNAFAQLYQGRGVAIRRAIEQLDPRDEQGAIALERELLRRWLVDADDFIRRHHLTVTTPFWPSTSVDQNPNGVAFAGSPQVAALVNAACAARGLDVIDDVAGNSAEARWEAVRRASVCVFDLTGYSRDLPRWERVAFGQVAYEIGLALTLGRPIVLLASPGSRAPFDIDLDPLMIDPAGNEHDIIYLIAGAIDAAFSISQRGGGETCIDDTIDYAHARWARGAHGSMVDLGLGELVAERDAAVVEASGAFDAVKADGALTNIFGFLGPEAPTLLKPAWPGRYPTERRCFHITAFDPTWADRVRQLVSESCAQQADPISYLRGDDADDADVIRSIWDEIGAATHLVVDITDLNLNALIELAMGHALGRKILLVTQDPSRSTYPVSLAKVRRVPYSTDPDGEADLWAALWNFLGDHPLPAPQPANASEATEAQDQAAAHVELPAHPEDVACPQAQRVLAHILSVVDEPADEVEEGLLSYVMLVPSVLEGLYAGARRADEVGKVDPLLTMIAEYFLAADDLIPDHIGIAGLVDDAYLALSCVQELNEQSIAWGKPPLVEFEFTDLNATIGSMLPEPITQQIQSYVDTEIAKASTKNWFRNNMGKTLLGAAAFAAVAGAMTGGGGGGGGGYTGNDQLAALRLQVDSMYLR